MSLKRPRIELKSEVELRKPEFWATHYYNVVGTEERGSAELIDAGFQMPYSRVDTYYASILGRAEEAPLISVPLVAGYDVAVQYVDCGEDGTELRYSLGHAEWTVREVLGYDSPHFALPAFRWPELDLLDRAMERSAPEHAAIGMLLLFPATYLTTSDDSHRVELTLARAWERIGLPHQAIDEGVIRSAVENQQDSELKWSDDAELGWINDKVDSFRNPKSPMTPFSMRRFERVRSFLAALEGAVADPKQSNGEQHR